jgi:hypothetical protein
LNAQHVVAEGGGGGIVNANRDWIGPWETFTLVDLNGGTLWDGDPVAFRAENGQYLQAVDGGGGTMLAIGGGPWAHETFTILNLSNPGQPIGHEDVVALQSWGGWYVVAEGGGGDVVNANRTAIGAWEQFWVVFH